MTKHDECSSGKIRYKTAGDAWFALSKGAGGVMAYRCHDCWGWHTTSHPRQRVRRG